MGRGKKQQRPGIGMPERVLVSAIARDRHGPAVQVDREPLPDGGRAGRVREGVAR
ncbi:hypothetical protein [Streptomyces sp. NPDC005533]|uniref:hypothetical protein n=1 Tax=Streptomyces sp. NPDC005533 TaxID=3364723 RepID=UPI0036BB29F4